MANLGDNRINPCKFSNLDFLVSGVRIYLVTNLINLTYNIMVPKHLYTGGT